MTVTANGRGRSIKAADKLAPSTRSNSLYAGEGCRLRS